MGVTDMGVTDEAAWPEQAQEVWDAYLAMIVSKKDHFSFFRLLQEKYEKYGQPDDAEKARLDQLLKTHDARVNGFKQKLSGLKVSDPHAYGLVVSRLSQQTDGADQNE